MEELNINNTAEDAVEKSSQSFANIPAPTAEIKVRTMQSDLASITASGGGLPRFNKVNVEGLSIARAAAAAAAETEPKKKNNLFIPMIIIAAVAVLAVGGFLLYNFVSHGGSAATEQNAAQSGIPPVSQSTSSPVQEYIPPAAATTTEAPAAITHVSLFKKPADAIVTLALSSGVAAQTASELETYDQQVLGVLASTTPAANFIEIDVKGGDGYGLSINELLSQADAAIIDPGFLSAHFNPDATFFAYRDKNGVWPGYVVALNAGENKAALQSGIRAIESSPKISNIFLTGAGTPSPSGFSDAVIAGIQVRILNFTGGAAANGGQVSSASFVYGWFGNDLIISASRDGFAQAVSRLQ